MMYQLRYFPTFMFTVMGYLLYSIFLLPTFHPFLTGFVVEGCPETCQQPCSGDRGIYLWAPEFGTSLGLENNQTPMSPSLGLRHPFGREEGLSVAQDYPLGQTITVLTSSAVSTLKKEHTSLMGWLTVDVPPEKQGFGLTYLTIQPLQTCCNNSAITTPGLRSSW